MSSLTRASPAKGVPAGPLTSAQQPNSSSGGCLRSSKSCSADGQAHLLPAGRQHGQLGLLTSPTKASAHSMVSGCYTNKQECAIVHSQSLSSSTPSYHKKSHQKFDPPSIEQPPSTCACTAGILFQILACTASVCLLGSTRMVALTRLPRRHLQGQ